MPLLPAKMPAQVSLTLFPKGVTQPNPVITTRRLLKTLSSKIGI